MVAISTKVVRSASRPVRDPNGFESGFARVTDDSVYEAAVYTVYEAAVYSHAGSRYLARYFDD